MLNLKPPGDLPAYIKIRKSKRARRLALRLDPKDRVFHLVIPQGVSLSKAHAFAEEHDSWMQAKLAKLPAGVSFIHGNRIPVFGAERDIHVYYDETLKRTSINLKNKQISVLTNLDDPGPRIARFLKKQVRDRLHDLSQEKAEKIGKIVQSVSVRDTKSRWGSCSADGNLSYSWRLIFAPYEALDYVVAHEVAHLQHLDHSRNFWNLCRDLSEDFVEGRYWMDNHGHELMRYGQVVTA